MPKSILEQIREFEQMFTVDRAKLKQIVAHFVKELEKGRQMALFPWIGIFRSRGDSSC